MSTHIMPTAMLNTKPPSNHKIAAAIEASMSVRDFVSIMFAFQKYLCFDRASAGTRQIIPQCAGKMCMENKITGTGGYVFRDINDLSCRTARDCAIKHTRYQSGCACL